MIALNTGAAPSVVPVNVWSDAKALVPSEILAVTSTTSGVASVSPEPLSVSEISTWLSLAEPVEVPLTVYPATVKVVLSKVELPSVMVSDKVTKIWSICPSLSSSKVLAAKMAGAAPSVVPVNVWSDAKAFVPSEILAVTSTTSGVASVSPEPLSVSEISTWLSLAEPVEVPLTVYPATVKVVLSKVELPSVMVSDKVTKIWSICPSLSPSNVLVARMAGAAPSVPDTNSEKLISLPALSMIVPVASS